MNQVQIRTLVAVDAHVDAQTVEALVAAEPGLIVTGVIDNADDWAARDTIPADVLVVACDAGSDGAAALVAEESQRRPDRPIIVLAGNTPNGFLRTVLEAGADDLIVIPGFVVGTGQLAFAIQKAATRKATPQMTSADLGELICVLGPKGGVGKTVTATNLAVALAEEGCRTAIVDLDLQFGDVGLALGLPPERSIYDLVTSGGTLDADKLEAFLVHHSSGARVLLAPMRPDQAASITHDFLSVLFNVLRASYEYVIVDTPAGFTPEVIAAVDAASAVCLVGTLDAPSLKNVKIGAETLNLMGYPAERIRLVLNRADTNVGVTHSDVVSVLGRAPDVLIPSHRDVVRAVNVGEPITLSGRRTEAAKAFRALAQMSMQRRAAKQPPAVAPTRRPKLLGRS